MALAILLAGCSMDSAKPTGFIGGDYSHLRKDSSGSLKRHISNPAALAQYSKVIIDPVIVRKHDEAKMTKVDEEEISQLRDYFEQQLKEEFGASFQVVSRPGRGTLRIRAAITDVRGSTPILNIHWSTLLTRAGVGGCAMEAEFTDSRTGSQLAAFMDTRMGRITGYFNGFSSTGHAKQVIRLWSKKLREELEQSRQGQVKTASAT